MKKIYYIILLLLFVTLINGCHKNNNQYEKNEKTIENNLIFEGTVAKIENSPEELNQLNPYVVTLKVEKIISGKFNHDTFSFRIHSPTKSEIEEGKKYRVVAQKTADGYKVEPYNWSDKQIK